MPASATQLLAIRPTCTGSRPGRVTTGTHTGVSKSTVTVRSKKSPWQDGGDRKRA